MLLTMAGPLLTNPGSLPPTPGMPDPPGEHNAPMWWRTQNSNHHHVALDSHFEMGHNLKDMRILECVKAVDKFLVAKLPALVLRHGRGSLRVNLGKWHVLTGFYIKVAIIAIPTRRPLE